MTTLTQMAETFPAAHAMRHRLGEGGRESLAHMLIFPEHGIAGFLYPTVLANGTGKGHVTLFGPALSEPIHEGVEGPVPDSMNFDDWQHGALRMAVREPHRVVDLSWDSARVHFKGRYQAKHPPYAFSMHPAGNPPYYGDDRTEQHGHVVADLSIDGKARKVEGWLVRDHSWGPRIWGLNQHYKWFHAITTNCSIHFFEMQSFGHRRLCGFLWRDGRMEHLADVHCDYVFDDQMMHKSIDFKFVDQAGRKARVIGKAFANIQLELDPMVYLNEAAVTLDIDGEAGSGWCEFCWNRDYFRFAKQHVTKYG